MTTPFFYEPPQAKIGTMRLASELVKAGNKVFVISSQIEGAPTFQIIDGIQILRLRVVYLKSIPITIPTGLKSIADAIQFFSPDVIHTHESIFPISFLSTIYAKKSRIPLIVTLHGRISGNGRFIVDLGSTLVEWSLSRMVLRNAEKIILLNDPLIERTRALGISDSKTVVIPNGIDLKCLSDHESSASRSEFKKSDAPFVVGFVGRLYPIKGISYLCAAIRKVVKKNRAIRFIFVGEGPLRTEVLQLAKEFPQNVSFLGYRKDANKIIAFFDILALPSISEGLPTVLIEALASGVPALASNIPENAAIIQDGVTGVLVPPKNSEAIANSILQLSTMNLSTMKQNCVNLARRHYSIDVTTNKVMKVYHDARKKS